jgi:hypothetical protein
MSEAIKHECGIALLRLKKPLEFYLEKYGTAFYALNKMYLLMEKQHNRGQDGAGLANIKLDVPPELDTSADTEVLAQNQFRIFFHTLTSVFKI